MGFDLISICSWSAVAILVLGGAYLLYQRYINGNEDDSGEFVSNFRHTKKEICLGSGD